jgi:hypothetical protein
VEIPLNSTKKSTKARQNPFFAPLDLGGISVIALVGSTV